MFQVNLNILHQYLKREVYNKATVANMQTRGFMPLVGVNH